VLKPAYRIKRYKHPRLKYVVRTKISGKWERKFFKTKAEAETYAQQKEIELLNQGREGVQFPSWLRIQAQRGQDRLQPHGKTISDAVDFYIKYLETRQRSAKVSQAIDELIENRKRSGASVRYCYDLKLRLGRFGKNFGDRIISTINTAEIDDWLTGLNLAPVTRNTFRRDLRTFFSFCITRRYCLDNPVAKTRKAKEIDGEIGILSVDQLPDCLKPQNMHRCRISQSEHLLDCDQQNYRGCIGKRSTGDQNWSKLRLQNQKPLDDGSSNCDRI